MARHDARRPLRLDHRSSCFTPLPTSMRWLDATSAMGRLKRNLIPLIPTDSGREQAGTHICGPRCRRIPQASAVLRPSLVGGIA